MNFSSIIENLKFFKCKKHFNIKFYLKNYDDYISLSTKLILIKPEDSIYRNYLEIGNSDSPPVMIEIPRFTMMSFWTVTIEIDWIFKHTANWTFDHNFDHFKENKLDFRPWISDINIDNNI